MLSHQSRKQVSRQPVCWRCLARSIYGLSNRNNGLPRLANSSARHLPRLSGKKYSRTYVSASRTVCADVESLPIESFTPKQRPQEELPAKSNIREQLQQWEAENDPSVALPRISDRPRRKQVINELVRSQDDDFIDEVEEEVVHNSTVYDDGELVHFGNQRLFLLPGDLVEIATLGGDRREVAIFVRDLDSQGQFYSMTGKWFHKSNNQAQFFVPGFVELQELDEILPYLPDSDVPLAMEHKLHNLKASVPRNIGKSLVQKLNDFMNQADAVYLKAVTNLDSSHELVAHPTKSTYATLEEIAERVLSGVIPKSDDGKFTKPALYAVHRSLMQKGLGFLAPRKSNLRAGGQYTISSISDVDNAITVAQYVRQYREDPDSPGDGQTLNVFAEKARLAIKRSRNTRRFITHGTVGPYSAKRPGGEPQIVVRQRGEFSASDFRYIAFLESWAALGNFGNTSYLNSIGSTILRVIGKYDNEIALDANTGWTCLQELGIIRPWQTQAEFDLRLPYSSSVLRHELAYAPEQGVQEDALIGHRKHWGDLPVYCIDDVAAHEIDDGISLETTDVTDEFWVHVHVADPSAHLIPKGQMSNYAQQLTETIYLPDRTVPLLAEGFVKANLSLAANRPCLTFSAKMNMDGDILDTKINPGIINNVLYITPRTVMEATTSESPPKQILYSVGRKPSPTAPSRPLRGINDLSAAHRTDLGILHKIAVARNKKLRAKGAIGMDILRPSVSVFGADFPYPIDAPRGSIYQYSGDPTIQVGIGEEREETTLSTSGDFVSTWMLLAGELAAKWCNARSIPIPYRVTPRIPNKENPAEFFNRELLPAMKESQKLSPESKEEYFSLMGQIQPSTTPGPHLALGLDMVTRCTSPLRRYTDLLVHWQIEAALLEEIRLGESLVGSTRDDYLPFSRKEVDALLPILHNREILIKKNKRLADKQYLCQFLLRAWKFGEAKLPSPLVFTVKYVNAMQAREVIGSLLNFHISSHLEIPSWTTAADIKVGDKFEVKLADVNIWAGEISLEAVRRLAS